MKKLLLLLSCCCTLQAMAFDTWWHAECTRKAMVANGFSPDARLATQVSNYFTDFMAVLNMGNDELDKIKINKDLFRSDHSYDFLHFDAIYSTADLEKNWQLIFDNTKAALRKFSAASTVEPGFRQIVVFNILGASLHIIQDFYSHSNWVNTYMAKKITPVPIWFDVPDSTRKKMNLFTGIYAKPFKGHVSHDSLHKDNSARLYNKEAVETAERASIDWIRRLMLEVPELDWAGLKSYNIQNNMVMKKYLVTQDASFLTSSSIIAFKFDGRQPKKFVFADNLPDEHAKASIVLSTILTDYASNAGVEKNKFRLLTPYWAGFMGYNISHFLSNGLSLNGEIFKNIKPGP
ncbi:hypothetical protein [Ferruginibacter sp. SUN106]|uniref:hypothetical protein n=1 Tax=Ferruginibacter sp. SUN106 TaxID=2978348 RepID=UPI003D364EE2